MEFWHTHPTESDLHFAQIINPIKSVETTHNSLQLEANSPTDSLQLEANSPTEPAKYSLLQANSPTAPPKYLEDLMSDHAMIPQMKKIKTENPLSSIRSRYGEFLQRLRKIAGKLPSRQDNSKNARLPQLLKFLMAELELKLNMNELKTESSEIDFWASIQNMAKNCGIDCGEFEKLCCSIGLEDVACARIPRLVDQVYDAPFNGPPVGCSLTGYFINMTLDNAFPWYPLDAAKDISYTTPSFQQLPFNKCQRQITISSPIKHPEQENLCTPSSSYSAFSTSLTPPLQHNNTSTISMNIGAPSEQRNDPCLLVYLNASNPRPQLPATVPKACRRRIQRQRKRATNYDHLSSNFGASTSSSTYNTNIVSASDLQFLLEKELKPSDVGSLGRIILPKRQAEEKLPHLEAKEGVKLSFQDLQTSQIWDLRFRFWPNNKTRMYLLESTGSFVKSHRLQEGDFIVLYRNPATGIYMINCKKATWSKCLGLRERRSLPSSREANVGSSDDKLSFGPAITTSMVKNPENEKDSVSGLQHLPTTMGSNERKTSSTNEDTDLLRWDIEDPDELMKGFSEIGAGSIDELFGLKE